MLLSLDEAAVRLGKTVRQIRYLLKAGKLKAKRDGARWLVDSDDLPLCEAQVASRARRTERLRDAAEAVFDPKKDLPARRYSVRDLKAFQVATSVWTLASTHYGAEHEIPKLLRTCLQHLATGCHRFDRNDKAQAYNAARDVASLAAGELALCANAEADKCLEMIEQDLMAAFAGLLRRTDRRRHEPRL